MKKKHLESMWRDLSDTPPARIPQVMFEAVLHTGPNQAIVLGYRNIGVDKGKKSRGVYLLKPEGIKGGRVEDKLKIDSKKGYGSRALVEMWDNRAWYYEGEKESGALNVLWESMLRWWRRKLTRKFSQVLRQSYGARKSMGSCKSIAMLV